MKAKAFRLAWIVGASVLAANAAHAITYTNSADIFSNPTRYGVSCCVAPGDFEGEIFTAPMDGVLTSMTFYTSNTTAGQLDFIISPWTGPIPVSHSVIEPNSPLYVSRIKITPGQPRLPSPITMAGINLSVHAGDKYIAYFSANGVPNGVGQGFTVISDRGPIGATEMYCFFCSKTIDPRTATTMVWWGWSNTPPQNLAYSAVFMPAAPVPEPGAAYQLGAGLAALAFIAKGRLSARRRSQRGPGRREG